MIRLKIFWRLQHLALLIFYLLTLWLYWQRAPAAQLAGILASLLLGLHVLELPLAWRMLRERQPGLAKLLPMTVLFGFTWWLPARWGVFDEAGESPKKLT